MAEYIGRIKNKKEEKIVQAFLSSLNIDFYTAAQEEEEALYNKMKTDQKTRVLTVNEKEIFLKQLKSAK
jgi:hypothetical protein